MIVLYALALVFALMCIVLGYTAYWYAWSWIMPMMWPTGPQWLIQPSFAGWLTACISIVIITLLMLKGCDDD